MKQCRGPAQCEPCPCVTPTFGAEILRCPSAVVYSKYLRPCGGIGIHSRLRACVRKGISVRVGAGAPPMRHHCLDWDGGASVIGLPFTLPIAFHLRTSRIHWQTRQNHPDRCGTPAAIPLDGSRSAHPCPTALSNLTDRGTPTVSGKDARPTVIVFSSDFGLRQALSWGKSHRGGNRLLLT